MLVQYVLITSRYEAGAERPSFSDGIDLLSGMRFLLWAGPIPVGSKETESISNATKETESISRDQRNRSKEAESNLKRVPRDRFSLSAPTCSRTGAGNNLFVCVLFTCLCIMFSLLILCFCVFYRRLRDFDQDVLTLTPGRISERAMRLSTHVFPHMYVCIYIYIYMYTHVYICMYICTF